MRLLLLPHFLLPLLLLYCPFIAVIVVEGTGLNHMATRLHDTFSSPTIRLHERRWINTTDQGYMMCAGEKMMPDVLRTLYDLRITWKSDLPIGLAHCDELSDHSRQLLHMFGNIQVINLCPAQQGQVFTLPRGVALKRLRGFFCKLAAMVVSPFQDTMFMDIDTIWFQDPSELFQARLYQSTGALFFRDRVLYHSLYEDQGRSEKPDDMLRSVLKWHEIMNITVDQAYVEREYLKHGINQFWRCLKPPYWNESFHWEPCIGQYQESSVMLMDKERHKKTRETLVKMIAHSEYDAGYGDKEMFWLAVTVSHEEFTFEPFLSGQYGDCSGFVLHFHPDDYDVMEMGGSGGGEREKEKEKEREKEREREREKEGNHTFSLSTSRERERERERDRERDRNQKRQNRRRSLRSLSTVSTTSNNGRATTKGGNNRQQRRERVRPLYLNAEYIVEYDARLLAVGEFLATSITKPVLVTATMNKPPHNNCYIRGYRSSNCTCDTTKAYECLSAPDDINLYVLRSQWLMMSIRREVHNIPEGHCMYLLNEYLYLLKRIFHDSSSTSSNGRRFDHNECFVMGCPLLPLMSVKNESEWRPGRGRICDPIRFTNVTTSTSTTSSTSSSSNVPGQEGEEDFATVAARYRRPLPQYNIPSLNPLHPVMQCGVKPSLYLYTPNDGAFHQFPNWPTFVHMGLDTDYVTRYREDDCLHSYFGETLPPV